MRKLTESEVDQVGHTEIKEFKDLESTYTTAYRYDFTVLGQRTLLLIWSLKYAIHVAMYELDSPDQIPAIVALVEAGVTIL